MNDSYEKNSNNYTEKMFDKRGFEWITTVFEKNTLKEEF